MEKFSKYLTKATQQLCIHISTSQQLNSEVQLHSYVWYLVFCKNYNQIQKLYSLKNILKLGINYKVYSIEEIKKSCV